MFPRLSISCDATAMAIWKRDCCTARDEFMVKRCSYSREKVQEASINTQTKKATMEKNRAR